MTEANILIAVGLVVLLCLVLGLSEVAMDCFSDMLDRFNQGDD